jgi:hypothetical protein
MFGAALLALASLPCAVVALAGGGNVTGRRQARLLRRLDRRLSGDFVLPQSRTALCIQQIAAELRRLDRQRRSGPTQGSDRWLTDVVRAYDEWLRLGCRCLGMPEDLDGRQGPARDQERTRIETALESAGLALRSRS